MVNPEATQKREDLTAKEVAERFGLNKHTVYRAIRDGKLKGRQFGRNYRISQDAIDEWTAAT